MSNAPEQLPGDMNKKTPIVLYILLGTCALAALVLAGVLGARLVWDIWGSPAGQTPADDSWSVVQQSGVMLVGTSSGYPPFEDYSGSSNLDGYDIALAYELGKKLGVQVNIQDIPFDSLFPALEIPPDRPGDRRHFRHRRTRTAGGILQCVLFECRRHPGSKWLPHHLGDLPSGYGRSADRCGNEHRFSNLGPEQPGGYRLDHSRPDVDLCPIEGCSQRPKP